ncbi:restriction endonuclease subunit S [Vibrio harveyi]|uniref:restriction endonuclease subunit S n=1 Tax=Vibrio harveyi TaxID=669 RepID=UPI00237EA094|nr:restriction endonuclease subunit S [Vibrio harveyi]
MYKVRVLKEIDDRLDAEYYNPAALSTLKKMETKGTVTTFGSLVNAGYRVVYHGTDSINGLKESELLPFLSPTQIDLNGAISFDDADKLPLYYKERYPKGLAKAGEILVEVKGNVSKVGIVPLDFPKNLMISGSLYKATLDPIRADSHYVLAFLKSRHGQILKNRLTSNTIINYIAKDALYSIPVIEFGEKAQKYIGDKVRQAEQLRAWAKVLYRIPAFIDALIQDNLPISLTKALTDLLMNDKKEATRELTKFLSSKIEDTDTKKVFQTFIEKNKMGSVDTEREFYHINTVATDAIEDFLSAQTYRPAITEAFDIITSTKHSSLQAMSLEPIRQGATPKFSRIGKKCIKSKQTRALFLDEAGYETVDPDDEQNKRIVRLKRNDILVTRQGAGTVGRASIFIDDEETYITDSLFLVRIDSNKANPAFIAGFLRSYTGQRLIEKGVYGSTGQLNLSSGALRNLPVPAVDLDFQNFLGEALSTADTLFKLSTRLTQVAKTLVESLIEGQLTEQQLIQAQQALDDGDNSLDRAILSQLSSEGYAIDGATPLFSDIDELYRLLESATQAEAEE